MEWWYFGPVVLAIIMFLLVGTLFEDRIETAYYQFMEHRRAQLAAMVAQEQRSTGHPPVTSCPPPTPACHSTPVLNTCAEPVAAPRSGPTTLTEVPASNVCGLSEQTAAKTPSKKSLRSRNSSAMHSSQSVVVQS